MNMDNFPDFMRNEKIKVPNNMQFSRGIEGYYYTATNGYQMTYWTRTEDGSSKEHEHVFEEYIVCVSGQYIVYLNDNKTTMNPGDELLIPTGAIHWEEYASGTRTIHVFGGERIKKT